MSLSNLHISRRRLIQGGLVVGAGAVAAPLLLNGSPAGAFSWSRTLQQGSKGSDVTELQIRVAGFAADHASKTRISIDGDFGPGTAAAVKRFQKAFGLGADGVVGPQTQSKLNSLEQSDRSTVHFNFSEFTDRSSGTFNGGKVSATQAKENARRLMWKLEALRLKLGNKPITVNSGFRSITHNRAVGGASDSMHLYGHAADLNVPGASNKTVYQHAETCGFSGLETFHEDHQHVDSRADMGRAFWWQDGVV